ncbi:WxL protein peptidoglycan domain-containing protein [Alicyclobacillus shizuokensis]|uniref:WxL protein peptidoglycan domain-containing protein n=1 Tax=Alicyclobacillus shizuokensis TaxID=392014 RepID=UPI000835780F|nr:DUF916 domain-containing protein [Alicyclobacillus shizuokensis]
MHLRIRRNLAGRRLRWDLAATAFLGASALAVNTALAAGQPGGAPGASLPFAVTPVLNGQQVHGVTGYFDVHVRPGQTLRLQMQVHNLTRQPVTVKAASANGLTMANGGVEYVPQTQLAGSRLLDHSFALASRISLPASIRLPASGSVRVPIEVKVPNVDAGTYLGGVVFSASGASTESTARVAGNQTAIIIQNRFNMAVAIALNLPHTVSPRFAFGRADVAPVSTGEQLRIGMSNQAAAVLKGLTGRYALVNENGDTVQAGSFGPFTMAPKTAITYPVPLQAMPPAGRYTLRLTAHAAGRTVAATRPLTIGQPQEQAYHEATGKPAPRASRSWWQYGAAGLVLVLVAAGVFLWRTAKRRAIAAYERQQRQDRQQGGRP